ncbi:MAG TPA: serine hydrolase domain-containing protein [Gemmatimonadales bacterium]
MPPLLPRRRFLIASTQGVLAAALAPIGARRVDSPRLRESPRNGPEDFPALQQLTTELMQRHTVPGVSLALVKDGQIAWHCGLGVRDAASRAPVDEHTVFEAASVSKTVFAWSVMQLSDRGVLTLDTPLTHYTPDRILAGDPRLERITARHVLSHTSGLPNFRSRAHPLRLQFTPGSRFSYSGEGYWYLQTVVTHLAGRVDAGRCGAYEAGLQVCASDIDTWLKRNVLAPLHMDDSTYVWNDRLERQSAGPHDASGKPLPLSRPTATDAARYAAMGGLRTTALDYARFLIGVLTPETPVPPGLSRQAREEMLRPQIRVDDTNSWALGWQIHRTPAGTLIQHEGGQTGFLAFTAASIERRSGYVMLTNSANGWKVFLDGRFVSLVNRILLT